MSKKKNRRTAVTGGFFTGFIGGAQTGAEVAPLILPVDPSGTSAVLVIGWFSLVGGIGGALGAAALTSSKKDDDDDLNGKSDNDDKS